VRPQPGWTSRRLLITAVAALVGIAAAIPIMAFGIVPLFVRSTVEEPPVTATTAGQAPAPATTAPTPTAATTALAGQLRRIDPVHYGSGQVRIAGPAGSKHLRFDKVDIAGAPNMFVYLSDRTDGQPGKFTDLGPLKATNGSFNYTVPADLDLSMVRSVVVWCRAFTVTVTWAPISA
jgi:hypothetical protein